MTIVIIDNYDSYTYNIFQMVSDVYGSEPLVIMNDEKDWSFIEEIDPLAVIISPGPGNPRNDYDFGISRHAVSQTRLPLLGVCLGHQGLGDQYGAEVGNAKVVMHGRISKIYHEDEKLFKSIPQGFQATRYHSLIISSIKSDSPLEAIAWAEDGTIMAIKHKTLPLFGVQYHPESICTEYGHELIRNFLDIAENAKRGGNNV